MLTKQALAKRIREARHRRKMTLKQVEKLSGFSSTHISEIERGRTSPTIAALTKIAEALSKDPCFFIEDRELEEVCVMPLEAAEERSDRGSIAVRSLSMGVLASHLRFYYIRTAGPFEGRLDELCCGDFCFYTMSGMAQVRHGKDTFALETGSSLHAFFESPPVLAAADSRFEMFVAVDPLVSPDAGKAREPGARPN